MKRPTRKVDANQAEIVQSLRACGAFVLHTHTLGQGAPDIFVFYNGYWTPIEIKSNGGKMTLDERAWWQDLGLEPNIAHDDQEAMKLCGIPIVPFVDPISVMIPRNECETLGVYGWDVGDVPRDCVAVTTERRKAN